MPYGVFDADAGQRIGIAIGDQILDLKACAEAGLLSTLDQRTVEACGRDSLNALMALDPAHWSALRKRVTVLLAAGSTNRNRVEPLLVTMKRASIPSSPSFVAMRAMTEG